MRRLAGWALLILSGAAALASLLADPYTAWGVAEERVRPGPAAISADLALASLALAAASAYILYRRSEDRRRPWAWPTGAVLIVLAAADLARFVWIRFFVLA